MKTILLRAERRQIQRVKVRLTTDFSAERRYAKAGESTDPGYTQQTLSFKPANETKASSTNSHWENLPLVDLGFKNSETGPPRRRNNSSRNVSLPRLKSPPDGLNM